MVKGDQNGLDSFLISLVFMKLASLIIFSFLVYTATMGQNKVIADIINFENSKGVCQACLFNNSASFNGEGGKPFQCVELSIKGKTVQAVFENIPPGTYALFILHDANSNNRMDKNWLGIPKEGYGASRNKLPFAKAPGFRENQFTIRENTITRFTIRLRNL